MYKTVKMYRTFDNKTFDSPKQAEEYTETLACDRLLAIVKKAAPDIKYREQTAIVEALFDNLADIGKLFITIHNWHDPVTTAEEEEEDD